MLPGKCRAHRVLTNRCVASVDLIGDQRAAIADAIAKYSFVTLSLCNRQRSGIYKIRQVTGCIVICTEVLHFIALLDQISLDLFFHLCSGMIVCHCDYHSVSSFV